MNCNFMALHYEIYSSSVTCGGLVCLSLKTGIVGGHTSTRVIQYGGDGGDPPSSDPCPTSWRPVPHIIKITKSPPISHNCWRTLRDFPSLHIVLLKTDTDFSYILPNKGTSTNLCKRLRRRTYYSYLLNSAHELCTLNRSLQD